MPLMEQHNELSFLNRINLLFDTYRGNLVSTNLRISIHVSLGLIITNY